MMFSTVLVICFAAVFSESSEVAEKPNILFIDTDNHSERTEP